MRRHPLTVLLVAVLAAPVLYAAAVALSPVLGWNVVGTTWFGVAQVVAFPGVVLLGLLVMAAACLAVAIGSRRVPSLRRISVGLLCLVVVAILLWLRPGPLPRPVASHPGRATWSVVTYNAAGELTPDALADLVRDADPDVLVLPETGPEEIGVALSDPRLVSARDSYQRWVSESQEGTAPVVLMIKRSLGHYELVPTPAVAYGALRVRAAGLPDVYAVHPAPPVPYLMSQWRSDVATVVTEAGCRSAVPRPVIVAGDLNSTLHHGVLAEALHHCVDVQYAVGDRWDGTWPTRKPAWISTTIDHVLVAGGVEPVAARVGRYGTSDHRALLTTVAVS